jgi:hypothetical protein
VKIELKNVKVFALMSDDSLAYTATVYVDDVRAFTAANRGDGGATVFAPVSPGTAHLITAAEEYARTLPPYVSQYGELDYDLELLIDVMAGEWQAEQRLKRMCRKKTVFRLPGQDAGAYMVFGAPYSAKVKAVIVDEYGPDVEIVNERFA